MQQLEDRVRSLFETHIAEKIALIDDLSLLIASASQSLVNCLLNNGKILLCGCAESAANASHFTMLLLNNCAQDRPPLPVLTLSADLGLITANIDQFFA